MDGWVRDRNTPWMWCIHRHTFVLQDNLVQQVQLPAGFFFLGGSEHRGSPRTHGKNTWNSTQTVNCGQDWIWIPGAVRQQFYPQQHDPPMWKFMCKKYKTISYGYVTKVDEQMSKTWSFCFLFKSPRVNTRQSKQVNNKQCRQNKINYHHHAIIKGMSNSLSQMQCWSKTSQRWQESPSYLSSLHNYEQLCVIRQRSRTGN